MSWMSRVIILPTQLYLIAVLCFNGKLKNLDENDFGFKSVVSVLAYVNFEFT